MRRTGKPEADDPPVIEIELEGGEPEQVAGGGAEHASPWQRIRRGAGRTRRSRRRGAVLAASAATALAVGLVGMRMWDDRAGEQARSNTVAAAITLAQGGAEPVLGPVAGTGHGSIQAVVHNAGPVSFSLIDVGADVPAVRITTTRVVGDARVAPGENGQFDISFATDCSKAVATSPNASFPSDKPIRMTLRVRTAAGRIRTMVIPVPQSDPSATGLWSTAQAFACGADAPAPMLLTWPLTASGFPKAAVHGNAATITVQVTLQGTAPATLVSFDALPGVAIQSPSLPLTLRPDSPSADITVTVTVTDCTATGSMTQSQDLPAQVEVPGSLWGSSMYISGNDGRITLALVGAISKICGG